MSEELEKLAAKMTLEARTPGSPPKRAGALRGSGWGGGRPRAERTRFARFLLFLFLLMWNPAEETDRNRRSIFLGRSP